MKYKNSSWFSSQTWKRTHACSGVVQVAKEGFGKGGVKYDEYRPSYSEAAVDLIIKQLNLSLDLCTCVNLKYEVLELGAGTGKFTEKLVPKIHKKTRYLATDPSRNFLDVLDAKSLSVDIVEGAACSIPLPDSSVQNIVCAQCFHWFSNVESLREMHRTLVPDGKLILIWNAKKYDEGWMKELYKQRLEVIERVGASTENWFNSMQWCKAIDSSPLFSLLEHHSLPNNEMKCSVEQVLATVSTVSAYNSLTEKERLAYLDELRTAILAYPDVDRDALLIPLNTEIYIYRPEKSFWKNYSLFDLGCILAFRTLLCICLVIGCFFF